MKVTLNNREELLHWIINNGNEYGFRVLEFKTVKPTKPSIKVKATNRKYEYINVTLNYPTTMEKYPVEFESEVEEGFPIKEPYYSKGNGNLWLLKMLLREIMRENLMTNGLEDYRDKRNEKLKEV